MRGTFPHHKWYRLSKCDFSNVNPPNINESSIKFNSDNYGTTLKIYEEIENYNKMIWNETDAASKLFFLGFPLRDSEVRGQLRSFEEIPLFIINFDTVVTWIVNF